MMASGVRSINHALPCAQHPVLMTISSTEGNIIYDGLHLNFAASSAFKFRIIEQRNENRTFNAKQSQA